MRRLALDNFVAAFEWLKARSETNGKVGAVGFCYGGGMVNYLATRLPDLAAGVPFYDTTPRFDAAAAKLAWERTLAHLNKYVR